jgi:two-component system sensor kinase FixL
MRSLASGTFTLQATGRGWLFALVYVLAYLALDWASYIRPLQGLNITPWNPQPALAIALLIWKRHSIWLVCLGLVAADLVVRGLPEDWLTSLAASVALSLVFAAIARALTAKRDGTVPFGSPKDVLSLTVVVTMGSLAAGIVYVLIFSVAGLGPAGSVVAAIARYWIGDAVGMIVTLPLLLCVMDHGRRARLVATLSSGWWWTITALTCILLWYVFGRGEQDYFKFFYLLLLPVVWASARFGLAGAVLSCGLTQVGLIVAVQLVLRQDLTVFELQLLMAAAAMTALLLGVLVDDNARAAAELRSSLRFAAAGQMAAALAHELNQPLTALNNYASACRIMLDGERKLDVSGREELAAAMQRVGSEAQRAGDVVRRLRDLFNSGATQLQLLPCAPTVRESVAAHALYADSLGVAITQEIQPDLPAVWLDPLQVAVVMRNLIVNAIESASAGTGRAEVLVRAARDRGQVCIAVHDSGRGIDARRLDELFDAAPSDKAGGMGVGLSICRAIVEAHGGRLWAESGPGGHFFFTLPDDDHAAAAI